MKRIVSGMQLIPAVLALGLTVGCATTQKESAPAQPADVSQAISEAKAAIAKAKDLDWIWRDTEKFLKQAEEAAKSDPDKALKLANKARNQADLAVNQYYLEKAKFLLDDASAREGLSQQQVNDLAAADKAIRNAEGRKAYDLLAPML